MPWRLIGAGLGVLAFSALIVFGVQRIYAAGYDAGTANMVAVLAEWKLAVAEQANQRRKAQQERLDALQGELDELRNRPEQVRIVTRTIRLKPDDRCESLPPDYLRLWNAGYESGVRVGAATAASRLDDAGRVALADAARVIEEAKYRFEFNAVRLTACQAYIRTIRKEPEK